MLFRLSARMIINKKEYSSVYLYRCVRGVIFYEEGWAFFVGHPTIKYRGHCDSNQTYIRGLVWVIFRLCYINMYIYIYIYVCVCVCITHTHTLIYMYIYIYIYIYMCVCVCVCVLCKINKQCVSNAILVYHYTLHSTAVLTHIMNTHNV